MKGVFHGEKLIRLKAVAAAVIVAAAVLCAVLPAFSAKTDVFANSAQRYWRGVDSFGVTSIGGECPLEVESEKLTFNVSDFRQNGNDEGDYSQTVTAEYNFYNPSDSEVTANLVFPFGSESYSDYGEGKYSGDIKVGGAPVSFNERYTYAMYRDFDLSQILRVRDDYYESGFFTRNLSVTRYYFSVGGVEDNKKYSPYASIKLPVSSGVKYALRDITGYSQGGGYYATVGKFVENGDTLELIVYGNADVDNFQWTIYENGSEKKQIDGTVTLKYKETTTFGEFVFSNYDEKFGVSRVDWFNASADCLQSDNYGDVLSLTGDFGEGFLNDLMRWYEYDLTVPAGGRVVNTVTAPLFPDADYGYSPAVYEYVYYSSPAKTWKSFGTLSVEINTPYYIVSDSDLWTKTDGGYTRFYETLPDEIRFKLSKSESPKYCLNASFGKGLRRFFLGLLLTCIVLLFVPVAVVIIVVVINYKKSRKKTRPAANGLSGAERGDSSKVGDCSGNGGNNDLFGESDDSSGDSGDNSSGG